MYVIKVFHGYISKDGQRTREKSPDKLLIFNDRKQSEAFADKMAAVLKNYKKPKSESFLLKSYSGFFLCLFLIKLSQAWQVYSTIVICYS